MNYYKVEDYNQKEDNKEFKINFVVISASIIQYHDCHQVFNFKNTLFCHLHFRTSKITCCFKGKTLASQSTAMLMKSLDKLLKIMSVSFVIKDIKTGYEF